MLTKSRAAAAGRRSPQPKIANSRRDLPGWARWNSALPRLGPLTVTIYACGLAGTLLLAAAAVASSAGGPPILATPTPAQLAALSYLAAAVTAVVFLAWYAAMKRLGADRTALFNGLIPIAALAAVALTGTGTITPLQCLAALTVLAGVILGLRPAPQAPAGTVNQAGQRPSPAPKPHPSPRTASPPPHRTQAAAPHPRRRRHEPRPRTAGTPARPPPRLPRKTGPNLSNPCH